MAQDLISDIPQDLTVLVDQLMLDLPSYGNRVIQRASQMGDVTQLYLITAGQVEIALVSPETLAEAPSQSQLPEPLPTPRSSQASSQARGGEKIDEEIYQIFFTTLERQYLQPERRSPSLSPSGSSQSAPEQAIAQALDRIAPSHQQFHWLILARQKDRDFRDNLDNNLANRSFDNRNPGDRLVASPWRILSLRSKLAPYPSVPGRLLSPARNSRQGPIGQGITLWLRDWHSGAIRFSPDDIRNR